MTARRILKWREGGGDPHALAVAMLRAGSILSVEVVGESDTATWLHRAADAVEDSEPSRWEM